MEKELASMEKEINKKAAKLSDLKEIEKKEARLNEKQEMLDRKEEMLEKGLKELKEEEENLKKNSFRMPQSELTMKGISGVVSEASKSEKKSTLAIYSLIEQARSAIHHSDFEGAKDLYDRIKKEYSELKDIEDRKKVYYEIMELKTDIELGLLG